MLIVDANVLLYAVDSSSSRHKTAHTWIGSALNGQETVGFAVGVLLTFLRLSTKAGMFDRPLSIEQAHDQVDAWLAAAPAHVVDPGHRHFDILRGCVLAVGTAGNLVPDAHLAALAIENRGTVISFDRDFDRFPGLRWREPLDGMSTT